VYPPGENAVPGIEPTSWPGPVVYFPSSPLRELEKQLPSAQVTFADGTDLAAAVALAKRSDVAVVFATQWATESIDAELLLPGGQDLLIAAVADANPRTIVVLETGGPVLMPWAPKVPAIVMAWYPGSEGGRAIAEVLTGKVNPSGHLPLTLPRSADQLAHPNPPRPGDVQYFEGAAVGYKWFDKQGKDPLFPFGHGLSYSTFSASDLAAKVDGLGIDVSLTWKNTGSVRGRDVAQVYAARAGWESEKRLVGYQEVELGPGERTTVHLKVDPRLLATFRTEARSWEIAAGDIELFAGTSSLDRAASVHVSHPGGTLEARAPHSAKP
jgi:beta-glucosidase